MTFTFADWSGFAALMLAIASPVITSISNNCHSTKLRKLDLREASERERRQILRRYLSATYSYLSFANNENLAECGLALGDALTYLPPPLRKKAIEINSQIQNGELDGARTAFDVFAGEVVKLND